jgi:alkylation response protein AidB-like acyl-CoA dehydrogenase
LDFSEDEVVTDVRRLANDVFKRRVSEDRLRVIDASSSGHDEALWDDLARSGLLGIGIGEAHGGAGLGWSACCAVLEEQARFVAPVPLWPHYVGAQAISSANGTRHGKQILRDIAAGTARVTVALEEYSASPAAADPATPTCTASPVSEESWLLRGQKAAVPAISTAQHVLVSAAAPAGVGLFLVDRNGPGVRSDSVPVTDRGPAGDLTLDGATGLAVGAPGDGLLASVLGYARVALAALQLGVTESVIARTAAYLSARIQFGRPLGTFQAAQHQMADCYIGAEAMRTTLWQAIDCLDKGGSGRSTELAVRVAKWWADNAGLAAVFAAVHLHGGLGVDVDYPLHRYFLWGKQLAVTLGGRSAGLAQLGALLASEHLPGELEGVR